MAYNASNEERKEILNIKKNDRGEHIKVAKILNKKSNVSSLDIRLFYTNADGELCPTQKGIRISDELAYDLAYALVGSLEENEAMDIADAVNNGDIFKTEDTSDDEDDTEIDE